MSKSANQQKTIINVNYKTCICTSEFSRMSTNNQVEFGWRNIQPLYPSFLLTAQWRKQWIREIKVFKKCPKVNPYCNAIFDPILFKPFLDGAKWPKFCAKYFSLLKKSNIGCIFFIFLWTIMKGWSDNYEIHTMYASCHVQKKTKKHKNYPGSPSLWKWVQSLKVEIFVIFFNFY